METNVSTVIVVTGASRGIGKAIALRPVKKAHTIGPIIPLFINYIR